MAKTTAGAYDVTIIRGDTFTLPVSFQDEAGNDIDITGRTYTAMVRLGSDDSTGTPALALTVTVTNAVEGELTISATAAQTATLAVANLYVWDLQETAGSTVTTLLAGRFNVVRDVTR